MLKKAIIIQVIAAVVIVGSYYIYKKQTLKKVYTTSLKEVNRLVIMLEEKYTNNEIPDKFYSLIKDIENKKEPKLVFRFSQIHCSSCVTREIRTLRSFANQIGWERIIFVATNSDEEDLNRFKRVSQIKTKIFTVDPYFFQLDDEPIDTPYMFIIDSDSSLKELFISMKENEVRTEQYLERISASYF
jgi:tryptophan synthase alpha subunit